MIDAELIDEPVIQGTVILELQCADGMRDAFNGIFKTVSPVIGGIHTPCISLTVMAFVHDTVHDGIAQVDIWRCHVDLCAERFCSVRKLSFAHARKEVEILINSAIPIGTVFAGLCQRTASLANLICVEIAHVCFSLFN